MKGSETLMVALLAAGTVNSDDRCQSWGRLCGASRWFAPLRGGGSRPGLALLVALACALSLAFALAAAFALSLPALPLSLTGPGFALFSAALAGRQIRRRCLILLADRDLGAV